MFEKKLSKENPKKKIEKDLAQGNIKYTEKMLKRINQHIKQLENKEEISEKEEIALERLEEMKDEMLKSRELSKKKSI